MHGPVVVQFSWIPIHNTLVRAPSALPSAAEIAGLVLQASTGLYKSPRQWTKNDRIVFSDNFPSSLRLLMSFQEVGEG